MGLVVTATAASAQIPGSFAATPTSSVTFLAQKAEIFALAMSSTVQATPLAISDSTAGASQQYTGTVLLTPTWDLTNNRTVSLYVYVSGGFSTGVTTLASAMLEASATGGTGSADGSWNPLSSPVDGHSSGTWLSQLTVTGAKKKVTDASEQVTVSFRMNSTNTYIDPGLYTGIISFAAHVQ